MKSIKEILERYDLELDKVVSEIKDTKAKIVLLQFPDGLKQYATAVVDWLEKQEEIKDVDFLIWFGSCYGACDTPVLGKELENKIDLIIQFGHNELMPNF